MNEQDRSILGSLDKRLSDLVAEIERARNGIRTALPAEENEPTFILRGLVRADTLERLYFEFVLDHLAGNKTHAAEVLGVDASTLHRKLTRWSTPMSTRVTD